MPRPPVPVTCLLVCLALLAGSCGDTTEDADVTSDAESESAAASSTTAAAPTASSTEAPSTTDVQESEADPDSGDSDSGDSDGAESDDSDEPEEPVADLIIDGSFERGELRIDDRRFEVELGSSVLITFESDEPEHIHLHGYDLLVDLVPGEPAELAFIADSPGSFEVELEDSGRFLFELLVR